MSLVSRRVECEYDIGFEYLSLQGRKVLLEDELLLMGKFYLLFQHERVNCTGPLASTMPSCLLTPCVISRICHHLF